MSIKQLIGYMMTFDQTTIDGVIGNVIDGNTNYISIEFSNEESKQQLINRLTTTNLNALMLSRSIPKQLSRYHSIRERLRFALRNPNIDKDALDKINDDLEKYTKIITKLSEDLVKCREDITATFYLENESGFYIPAGFWFLCSDRSNLDHKGEIKCEIIPDSLDGSIKLRQYQAEDVPVVLKYKRATLVYGTGLGKSVMIAAICTLAAKSKKRTIVITPSVYLAEQIYGTISKFHPSCTYAHGTKDPALGKDVLVVTAFSAKKYIQSYHVAVIDECLPYNQKIITDNGVINIGTLYNMWDKKEQLPLVMSLNEKNNTFEYKKITHAWKRDCDQPLITIKTSRIKLTTTFNHQVLTKNKGWIASEQVEIGDLLIGPYVRGKKQSLGSRILEEHHEDLVVGLFLGDGSVKLVSKNRYRVNVIHSEEQKDYLFWLADAFGQKNINFIEKNGYSQKSAYSFNTYCFDMIEEFPKNKKTCPQWIIDRLNPRSLAIWIMDDGTLYHKTHQAHISTCSFDDDSVDRLVEKLCQMNILCYRRKCKRGYNYIILNTLGYNALVKTIDKYIHKSMSYKAMDKSIVGTGEWNFCFSDLSTFPVTKMEKKETFKKDGEGFGLFDLEIEDNHNFVTVSSSSSRKGNKLKKIPGIVVHNCHHSSAQTWFDLLSELDPADHVYNFTATPYREDGMEAALFAFSGPVLIKRDVKWGISNGFLEHFDFYKINYTVKDKKGKTIKLKSGTQATTEYKTLIGDTGLLRMIANKVENAIKNNRKVIILFKYLTIANTFAKMLPKEHKIYVADANFKKPLHDFKNNNASVLIATAKLVGEGVDIPLADVLINMLQNSSGIITYQTLGRVLRKGGSKPIVIDVVAVNSSNFKKYSEKRSKILSELADKTTIIDV